MANVQVTCIVKPDRTSTHEHITHVGGQNWCITTPEVIANIEKQVDTFYTSDGRNVAHIGVRTSQSGRKYVQTFADGVWNNNLLALDTCPLR